MTTDERQKGTQSKTKRSRAKEGSAGNLSNEQRTTVLPLFSVPLLVHHSSTKPAAEWISQQGYGGDGKAHQRGEAHPLRLFAAAACVNGSPACFVRIACNTTASFVSPCLPRHALLALVWVSEFVALVQGGMAEFVVRFMAFVGCYSTRLVARVVVFCGGDEREMSACGSTLRASPMLVSV